LKFAVVSEAESATFCFFVLYHSGVLNRNTSVKTAFVKPGIITFSRGNKFFELSNHLGNVLVTVSDKKTPVDDGTYEYSTATGLYTKINSTPDGKVDYYTADIVTAQDYYPFGMMMLGRKYTATTTSKYRYGFNGKENDNEVKGEGNQVAFEARIYDARLGRFLSIDPRASDYATLSPYAYAANSPIALIDKYGEGPDDPPGHIVTAIKAYSSNFYNALYHSNNTSNNQLYLWAMAKTNDPNAYSKVKGAVGEAIFKSRANDLAATGITAKGPYIGVPHPHYLGGRYTHAGVTYQVDVQTKIWTGGVERFLGLPKFTVKAGIAHHNFDGSFRGVAKYGSQWKSAVYTLNYEVKALSPVNDVEYNFRKISEGVQQAIDRGQGKNAIGILVVDTEAWNSVANDPKYGALLKEEYNRLYKKDAYGERNYLKLEDGLANEAQRGAYGLKDAVIKAEQQNTQQNTTKPKKKR
jgi:RHS repeat-associated protein